MQVKYYLHVGCFFFGLPKNGNAHALLYETKVDDLHGMDSCLMAWNQRCFLDQTWNTALEDCNIGMKESRKTGVVALSNKSEIAKVKHPLMFNSKFKSSEILSGACRCSRASVLSECGTYVFGFSRCLQHRRISVTYDAILEGIVKEPPAWSLMDEMRQATWRPERRSRWLLVCRGESSSLNHLRKKSKALRVLTKVVCENIWSNFSVGWQFSRSVALFELFIFWTFCRQTSEFWRRRFYSIAKDGFTLFFNCPRYNFYHTLLLLFINTCIFVFVGSAR